MPAITVDDTLVLPRIPRPDPAISTPRPVDEVITAHRQVEGAGFTIRRPFPGGMSLAASDPFLPSDLVLLGGGGGTYPATLGFEAYWRGPSRSPPVAR